METTNKSTSTNLKNILSLIRTICHFLPLLTSLVWIIHSTLNPSNFIADYLLLPIALIGWGSALIARPLKFFTTALKLVIGGWTIGWAICPFFPMCILTALIGALVGFFAILVILVYAPAVITILCFVKDLIEKRNSCV